VNASGSRRRPRRSRFHAGTLVRIRSAEQIAATLDEDGALDRLPFMPEMTAYCGQTFVVRSSAHKTCDSINMSGIRGLEATVHLEGMHCDGSAHGGCQSRCPLFFKDAWLEPAEVGQDDPPAQRSDELERKAARSVPAGGRDPARGTYSCQGTAVLAASMPLPFWWPRQYWDDVRSGNIRLSALLRGLPMIAYNKFQYLSRRLLPEPLRIRGGRLYPDISGRLERTPDVRLGIEPGEAVAIRSQAEILDTLDTQGRNRGLAFDVDMVPFCDRRAIVRHRVQRRIDERTGALVTINNPCLVLDGVACRGRYHRFCPRGLDCYWREAWLKRIAESDAPPRDGA
jgi:hypothetical protein